MRDDILSPVALNSEKAEDNFLRPQTFEDFIGQESLIENLKIFVEAAKMRNEALDHVLLAGPPGLGKTTLANIIANEMLVSAKSTSGPAIERKDEIAAILTDMDQNNVLFIDEIHRLNRTIEECLYPAMEDFKIDIIIGEGPHAKSIKLDLPSFTLVGATTRSGMITSPLRSRFGITLQLQFYNADNMFSIVKRSSRILNISIDEDGAYEIAKRSRGTPRISNRLLKRVRDYAQVKADGHISGKVCIEALKMFDVDELGLDNMDRRFIMTIIDKFGGGPVGINTISVAIGEEPETIEDVYEPYLIQIGFLNRTPRGRILSESAYKHFNKVYHNKDIF